MRILLLTLSTALAFPATAADPPTKRKGGFFGFGAPPAEQISAGLFPDADGQAPSGNLSSSSTRQPAQSAAEEGIFRSGEPARVAPVSYVIENGRKVERPVAAIPAEPAPSTVAPAKPIPALQPLSAPASGPVLAATAAEPEKKRGFFGFGKKEDAAAETNPAIPPVPAAPLMTAAPVPAAPVSAPAPIAKPAPTAAVTAEVPADTPVFAGETKPEKDRGSWIPFLGRKKSDESANAPTAPVIVAAETAPAAPATTSPSATPAPAPAKPAAGAPASKPAGGEVATFEIRRDDSKPAAPVKEEKTAREGGILTPITKIRPPKKEIDLTGAETIIADGEIVKETSAPTTPVAPASGSVASSTPRQAPQVVNGVKTYSSWEDVNARSSSAADRIISKIR